MSCVIDLARSLARAVAPVAVAAALLAGCKAGAPPPAAAPDHASTSSLPPGHPPLSGGASPPPADPSTAVSGTVALDGSLLSRLAPTDVLYVIARNAKTNAVVAVRREEGIRFPHAFEISSADVMMEGTAFSGPFDIVIRVSKTGDAIPGRGDLEGTARGVAAGARGVAVTIDSVRQ